MSTKSTSAKGDNKEDPFTAIKFLRPLTKTIVTNTSITDPQKPFHETPFECSPDEIRKLYYLSHEVEVKTYMDFRTRSVRNYRVTRVVSPFHFYTEFDMDRPHGRYNDWFDAMQDFYNNKEESKDFRVRTSSLLKFRCYAHLDSQSKKWERIRVFKVDSINKVAEVYFCDVGQFRLISFDSVMEMHPDFTLWTAQGFRTHLIHVRPVNGSILWSKEAVDFMKKLVQGKTYRTIVMSRSELPMPEGFPERMLYNGVVMIQRNPHGERTLQAELVKAGYAVATGFCAGYLEMLDFPRGVPGFNLQDLNRVNDSLFVSEPDGIAVPPQQKVSEEVIRDIMKNARDHVGFLASNTFGAEQKKNPITPFTSIYERIPPPELQIDENHFPTHFQNRIGHIKFSHVISPSICYVQIQMRLKELHQMEAALTIIVEKQPPVPLSEERAGIPIACLLQEDRERDPVYVRAYIKQTVPKVRLIKVLLVDYGNEISVKYNLCRYLPEYFKKIPSFAHRIHLDTDQIFPAGGRNWSSDASDSFRKYIISWDHETPIYYGYRPTQSLEIPLEDYNQDLHYDGSKRAWCASPIPSRLAYVNQSINKLKEDPLLASLFTSIGVDVNYEILLFNSSYFKFECLADMLLQSGFAHRVGKEDNLGDEHDKLVKAVSDMPIQQQQASITAGKIGY